ncbi:MAG TPA: hypothetical protein PKN87_09850 [Syntrophomonadaceae bacterium]|nr:hypothetical protein [Syntrophomonadaceae bacterium]HPR92969.1 hypothetical protein [Syntrophomonadaceae bacterium]
MGLKDKFCLGAWNVGIIESGIADIFDNPNQFKIRWVKHRYRDRYFADPFLYKQDEKYYYILVEEYVFYEDRGKISCLKVDRKTFELVNKEIILNEAHHLSFPFVREDWIIPEGYKSGATYAYQELDGGKSYRRIKISDEALIDPALLEYNDKYWLFATTKKVAADSVARLSIYYADRIGEFTPHEKNPVKIDIKTARPAGQFFRCRGKLFRPVMDCEQSYGHSIRIMEVEKLSVAEFHEKEVLALTSQDAYYNRGFHTFNVYDGFILVDGYREYFDYLRKPLFVMGGRLLLSLLNKFDNQGKKICEFW